MSTQNTQTLTSIRKHADYLDKAFAPDLTRMVETFLDVTGHLDFDTIVGTGLSGALVVPTIARALGLKWAIVRKDDGSHSNTKVEGEIGHRYLFVDDLVDSGRTLARVQSEIDMFVWAHNRNRIAKNQFRTEYVGTYEYYYERMHTPEEPYDYH